MKKQMNNNTGTFALKQILISIGIISGIMLAIGTGVLFAKAGEFTGEKICKPITEYKSIHPLSEAKMENLTARQILDVLAKQDDDMHDYISNVCQNGADNLFEVFYNNIHVLTPLLYEKLASGDIKGFDIESHNVEFSIDDIKFETINNADIYKFSSPRTDLYTYQANPAVDCLRENENYLNSEYSHYLSSPWRDYLYLANKNREPYAAPIDAINVDRKTIGEWIISWNNFIKKYPNFVRNKETEELLEYISDQFIGPYYKTTSFDSANIMTKEARQDYENFLAKVDKNSKEYTKVKNWYDIVKKNNFRYSENLY